ncbi:MAG: hypothetical protein GY938_11080 [Ketobacter sp.]|nr:hypothetical protein [Ketobacter sp.]
MRQLRQVSKKHLHLTTYLLVQAFAYFYVQHLWLVGIDGIYQRFTFVDLTTLSWLPTALMLAVAIVPRSLIAILVDEATLSQGLHTSPLPVTHALVGYRWQHIGLCPVFSGTTAIQATSCRTFAYPPK